MGDQTKVKIFPGYLHDDTYKTLIATIFEEEIETVLNILCIDERFPAKLLNREAASPTTMSSSSPLKSENYLKLD